MNMDEITNDLRQMPSNVRHDIPPRLSTGKNPVSEPRNATNLCHECDGEISKDGTKSKSPVWKRVIWFTRIGRTAAKNDVCQCQITDKRSSSNSLSLARRASKTFRRSVRRKLRKAESSQFERKEHKHHLDGRYSQPSISTTGGSLGSSGTNSPTATGNFCDFGATNQSATNDVQSRKSSLLTEIAREINPPLEHPLSLPDVTVARQHRHVKKSSSSVGYPPQYLPNFKSAGVSRSRSFPGSQLYHYRLNRITDDGPSKMYQFSQSSPPTVKVNGLQRAATFSSRLRYEPPKASLKKSKSMFTDKIENASSSLSEIRDQSGSVVGIVHFYKSPKKSLFSGMNCTNHASNHRGVVVEEGGACKKSDDGSRATTSGYKDPVDCDSDDRTSILPLYEGSPTKCRTCSLESQILTNSTSLEDCISIEYNETSKTSENMKRNICPTITEDTESDCERYERLLPNKGPNISASKQSLAIDSKKLPRNQEDFNVLDDSELNGSWTAAKNINTFNDQVHILCDSNCTVKSEHDVIKEQSTELETFQETGIIEDCSFTIRNTSRSFSPARNISDFNSSLVVSDIPLNNLVQQCGCNDSVIDDRDSFNVLKTSLKPVSCKYNMIGCGTRDHFTTGRNSSSHRTNVSASDFVTEKHQVSIVQSPSPTSPGPLASTHTSDYVSILGNDLRKRSPDIPIHSLLTDLSSIEIGLPVPGETFKMRTELMLAWFQEFNDEQRNIILKKILNRCELPQMHLLSVAMENNLHKSCPPNCQDMLVWLPYTVTMNILMYLDPVSLCRCNQVNRAWRELTDNSMLWQRLTRNPDFQLSEASSKRQFHKFTLQSGEIHWKKVFAERYLLQKNWLNGTYKLRTFEGHDQGIACVQFDDTRIVSGSSDKTIKLWDISNTPSELMLTLEGHSGTVRCLDLNGNRLVSGSTDRTIKVWDLSFASYWAGASCKVTMVGHLHTVRCLQADERKLVSGSYDKTVKVWDLKTGECRLTMRGHTAAVLCVQFDEQKIVSGSYDKKIKVWDLNEGTCLMTLDGHQDAVTCLNLTHDGMKIITGSLDYSLKFWDLCTGKCYGTLDWITSEGHTAVVRCLQVDSWRIVSGGDDKTLKVWELATGQRLLTLRYHSDGVTCMQFNDFAIVSGSYDRTVKLWDFTPKHSYLETYP